LPSEFGAGVRVSWNLEFGIASLVSAGLKGPKGNLVPQTLRFVSLYDIFTCDVHGVPGINITNYNLTHTAVWSLEGVWDTRQNDCFLTSKDILINLSNII
jgi:hypothetical protein